MKIKFKVGDLITAYHSGIHRITEIERRFYKDENDIPSFLRNDKKVGDEYAPIIWYEKVLQENGEIPTKGKKKNRCDGSYCEFATEFIRKEERKLNKLKDNFVKL
jgi:hypothetical protein